MDVPCESAVDGSGGGEEEGSGDEEGEEGDGKQYYHDRPLGIYSTTRPLRRYLLFTYSPLTAPPAAGVCLSMWEFGQNDPNRDSGSKLKRLGFARYQT